MRLPIVLVLLFSFFSILTAQRSVRGSGNVVSQERTVDRPFTKIETGGATEVEITKGKNHAIRVETDDNLQEYLLTETNGETLQIRFRSNTNIRNMSKLRIYVTMPELTGIDADGASKVTTMSAFSGDDMDIEVGSAAIVKVEFTGNRVKGYVGSAGTLELVGATEEADYTAGSAGTIRAKDMIAKRVSAKANSAGSIKMTATEEIRAKANSAGSIRYDGNPEKVFTDADSGGSIKG